MISLNVKQPEDEPVPDVVLSDDEYLSVELSSARDVGIAFARTPCACIKTKTPILRRAVAIELSTGAYKLIDTR